MLSILVSRARHEKVPAVVLTFDPHPIELLRPDAVPPRLTTMAYRAQLLERFGVDRVIILSTSPRFLSMSAEDFFHTIIRTELQARGMVEGSNFFFGRNRSGNITMLKALCAQHHVELDVIPPVTVDDQLVSSSVIRSLIEVGDISDAVRLLGHSYRLSGFVGTGAARGRQIGFPTANLTQLETLVPGDGVYAARVDIQGIIYPAAVNIGPNPTFGESSRKVEVHVLDFHGDLYGTRLDVDFLKRIRDVMNFASVEDLKKQLQEDVAVARTACKQ
jgi:riboflavin kinase/FMN adenylyltransferase